jgi:hypothetical protein
MAEFLLIHGAGHGVRCWRDVIPTLAAVGHSVRAIDPAYQMRVSKDWPAWHRHDLDTGHSPFFAAPDRLAAILDHIAKATP